MCLRRRRRAGASETSVVRCLLDSVAHVFERPLQPPLHGTSVGAISACVLATLVAERDDGDA